MNINYISWYLQQLWKDRDIAVISIGDKVTDTASATVGFAYF